MFGSGFVVHDRADPTWLERRRELETATADYEPRHLDDVRDRSDAFTEGGHFSTVTRRTYRPGSRRTRADEYVELLATMSTFRALEDDVRQELFERIKRRIRARRRLGQSDAARRALRSYNRLSSTVALVASPA